MRLIVQVTLFKEKIFPQNLLKNSILKMNQIILLTYLTFSLFMRSTWTVTATSKKVDNIRLIYDFLLRHESGEFGEYAESIKKENNINAKNNQNNYESALHKGIC
jgi:hypothetical protein